MGRKVQVVFDCRDPEGLSKFYAEALHYKAQDPPEGFKSWEEALKAWGIPPGGLGRLQRDCRS